MAIPPLRFGHVAFRVSDAERSVRWYKDAFGARRVFHAPRDGERPELMFLEFAKGQFIELFTGGVEPVMPPANAAGYQHFCLAVDDLKQMLEHLAAMNVHPQRPPRPAARIIPSPSSPTPTAMSSSSWKSRRSRRFTAPEPGGNFPRGICFP